MISKLPKFLSEKKMQFARVAPVSSVTSIFWFACLENKVICRRPTQMIFKTNYRLQFLPFWAIFFTSPLFIIYFLLVRSNLHSWNVVFPWFFPIVQLLRVQAVTLWFEDLSVAQNAERDPSLPAQQLVVKPSPLQLPHAVESAALWGRSNPSNQMPTPGGRTQLCQSNTHVWRSNFVV